MISLAEKAATRRLSNIQAVLNKKMESQAFSPAKHATQKKAEPDYIEHHTERLIKQEIHNECKVSAQQEKNKLRSDIGSTVIIENQTLIDWALQLQAEQLPQCPFELTPGVKVINGGHFLSNLKQEIARGPNTYRARTGVLHDDLLKLNKVVTGSPG